MESYIAVLIIGVLLFLTAAILIVRNNRENQIRFTARTEKSWGKLPSDKHSAEEYESISHYFRDRIPADRKYYVDDITWNDCNLDSIFRQINAAVSSPGEDILYNWLRTPEVGESVLKERERMIGFYGNDESARLRILRILNDIGKGKKLSMYDSILNLRKAERIGTVKYVILCILMAVGLVCLFIQPIAALAILLPVIAANIVIYLKQKERTGAFIRSFSCVLRLAEAADRLAASEDEIIASYKAELKELTAKLAPLRRGAFLLTSSSAVGTGLSDMLLEYLKILFHLDLIKYDRMVDSYRGNEEACIRIYEIAGTIDAAIAVASYREYLGRWCRPVLVDSARGFTEAEELYHPLLKNPVPVTFSGNGGILITGSNASGKSTFLKNMAIASILAQSINTVPAKNFRSSFYRIYTSMALQDNMGDGDSYFIVEIRSLKRIVDAAKDGSIPVLGIVDEVLRGTNTIERISASSQILKRLADTNAVIFAATHDIELSYILEGLYSNYHFTEQISDGDVKFDYTLRKGRADSRNAIALLEAFGYGEETAKAARQQAERFERSGEWSL